MLLEIAYFVINVPLGCNLCFNLCLMRFVVCLLVFRDASPPLADLVTWFANFIQLTPSRRALWREEKKTTREKLVFSTFRN